MNSNSTVNLSEFSIEGLAPVPKDIIFPNELNKYLRDQLNYLVHENGMLKKNLQDQEIKTQQSEEKIAELSEKLKDLSVDSKNEFIAPAHIASTKIVELSKKLRDKNVEVESLKTKISRTEFKLNEVNKKMEVLQNTYSEEKPKNELEEQVKKLQDKLNATTNKLMESRNINMQLKNDLQQANKWLKQEVGESFENLNQANNSNWRGRAQLICDLQQKNSELREKLKSLSNDKPVEQTNSTTSLQTRYETKILALNKELEEVKGNLEEIKRKFEGAKARYKSVDSDYQMLKIKHQDAMKMLQKNQEIISNLTTELSRQKEIKSESQKQKDVASFKLKQENTVLMNEIKNFKIEIDRLLNLVKDKEEEINELKVKETNNDGNSTSRKADKKAISRLEAEKLRLLELLEVQNKRLEAERNSHFKTTSQLRFEKQRAAKLEANVARLELDQPTTRSGNYSSSSKSRHSLIEDQLQFAEENVKALQTRLEMEKMERKTDLQEFIKILKDSGFEQ